MPGLSFEVKRGRRVRPRRSATTSTRTFARRWVTSRCRPLRPWSWLPSRRRSKSGELRMSPRRPGSGSPPFFPMRARTAGRRRTRLVICGPWCCRRKRLRTTHTFPSKSCPSSCASSEPSMRPQWLKAPPCCPYGPQHCRAAVRSTKKAATGRTSPRCGGSASSRRPTQQRRRRSCSASASSKFSKDYAIFNHAGLAEPRGTSTVRNAPGVFESTTWSVMP